MSEFWKRTLSGAVYVGVVIGSILFNEIVFLTLSIVLAWLALREYNSLTHPRCMMDFFSEMSAVICVFPIVGAWLSNSFNAWTLLTLLLPVGILIAELWDQKNNPIVQWGHFLVGQVMIVLPFALMNVLCNFDPYLLLAVFVLIWVNDSGAYCVGMLSSKMPGGNHKMFPRVSPKKSWEGLFGGLAFTIGTAFILNRFGWFDAITKEGYELLIAGGFAFIVSGFGTLGDLMESLFKRTIGVKDSGKFLPGHGGVLDRFDSILLAAPMALLYVLILRYFV
jgi:phosphatidate cytidylyltransferase